MVERQPLAWDITVPDTYADSHLNLTSSEAGSAARQAASKKNTKYINITSTYIFYDIAIETAGSCDVQALEVIEESGRRITEATEDPKETMYLFQRLSMAIQRGNAMSFFNTFDKKPRLGINRSQQFSHYLTIFSLQALCSRAQKK